MNGLRVIVQTSCIFGKDYFTFYNHDWSSNLGINFSITFGKCSIKLLSDIAVEIRILEISKRISEQF